MSQLTRGLPGALHRLGDVRRHGMHQGYWDGDVGSQAEAVVRANTVLARRAGVRTGDRVLDAGCGLGGAIADLERDVGAHGFGVTLRPQDAATACRRLHSRGIATAPPVAAGDMTRLPFAPGRFDVVWAMESLCYVPDWRAFIAEAFRVLTPGGKLAMWDPVRLRTGTSPTLNRDLVHVRDGWGQAELRTLDDLLVNLSESGFVHVQVEDCREGVTPSLRRQNRIGHLLRVATTLTGRSTPAGRSRLLADIQQWRLFRQGVWTIVMVVATRLPEASST